MRKGKEASAPTPYKVVAATDVRLFFEKRIKRSYYLEALQQLVKDPDKVLEFVSVKPRFQIKQQATKHNLKILFAEQDGKLYVKLDNASVPLEKLKAFLASGPKDILEIEKMFRDEKMDTVKPTELCRTLLDNYQASLITVDGKKKYKLTPSVAVK